MQQLAVTDTPASDSLALSALISAAALVQSLVAYILCSAGGTSMGSILLGQPIGWLTSDVTVCTYLLIFALSHMTLTRELFRFIVNLEPFSTIISVVDDMSWGNCVTMLGVQRALNPLHAASPVKNSASAAILLGTLAGCGGGLLRSGQSKSHFR